MLRESKYAKTMRFTLALTHKETNEARCLKIIHCYVLHLEVFHIL